jgi:probable F420-dependent oxidoreductase
MKIDSLMDAAPPAAIGETARRLEETGFDCVWTFEAAHDPFIPLAHTAAAATRIEIGTNIAVAFARTPFSMAQVAWDLQRFSGGRFHLGLGTQVRPHVERRLSAEFEHPAARITDYVRCMRAIWDTFQNDTRPDYEGPFYRFKLINPFFDPGPNDHPEIPIYLAGLNPRMCRAAGEVADGFHVHPMHSVGYLEEVVKPALDEGARSQGKTVADLVLYAPVLVVTGDSQTEMDESAETVRSQIAFYGSTPNYRALLEFHGYGDLGKQLNTLMREGKMDEMGALIPDALLEEIAVVAPANELGAALRARYDGVLDRVALYSSMGDERDPGRWKTLVDTIHAD